MKRFITTAAIVTALALPAFAEGDDQSAKSGEPKGSVKATTDAKQDAAPAGSRAMGQGVVVAPRATTGSATDQLNKDEASSPANPGKKTGVTGGSDGGGGGGAG